MTNAFLEKGYWGEGITAKLSSTEKLNDTLTLIGGGEIRDFNWNGVLTATINRVHIKTGITKIGKNAFSGLKKLPEMKGAIEYLTLPNTLKEIGDNAFSNQMIKELEVPGSVDTIGVNAFVNNQIHLLILNEGLKVIKSGAFAANRIDKLFLPNTMVELDNHAFSMNQLESVKIPEGLNYLGDWVFSENELDIIFLPKTLQQIPENLCAFNKRVYDNIRPYIPKIRTFETGQLT